MDLKEERNVFAYMIQAALPLAAFLIFGFQKVHTFARKLSDQLLTFLTLGCGHGLDFLEPKAQMGPRNRKQNVRRLPSSHSVYLSCL